MAVVAMKQLLEAGVHFGHQTRRWDPKMAEYIFQARNGIHIIDLQKTSKKIDEAYAFLKEQVEEGKTVLFVGTKKQAQECVKEAAEKSGMYYALTGKMRHMAKPTTREKLLSYLSAQAARAGGPDFDIPLDRQQLADYLAVDRSAMSAVLGKLREEGVLEFRKNHFRLLGRGEERD